MNNDEPKQQLTEKTTQALAGFFQVAGEENIAPDVIMGALLASGLSFAIRLGLTNAQIAEMMATLVTEVRVSVPASGTEREGPPLGASPIGGTDPPVEMP